MDHRNHNPWRGCLIALCAGLGWLTSLPLAAAVPVAAPPAAWTPGSVHWPEDSGFTDVRKLGAKGDGRTDDTAAIRAALSDKAARAIYFPPGVYLVSDGFLCESAKRTFIQGAGPDRSIIRLVDGCPGFSDPQQPKAVFANEKSAIGKGGNGQAFRNSYFDLCVEVGAGNPGAIGIMYFNDNQGTMHNVTIRSRDPQHRGKAGLALVQNWPGPALFRYLRIEGFDYGVWSTIGQYSLVFEHLSVEDQRVAGIFNAKQKLAIRDLRSRNAVPALIAEGGLVALIDAQLAGGTGESAITGRCQLLARNITATGYRAAIAGAGSRIVEYTSEEVSTLGAGVKASLALPVAESPQFDSDDPQDWANAATFGPGAEGLQKAIDSGKPIVYLPRGNYTLNGTIHVRGKVRRIALMESSLTTGKGDEPVFRIEDGDSPFVIIERFDGGYESHRLTFEHASTRTLAIRTMLPGGAEGLGCYRNTVEGGRLFLDDVCAGDLRFVGQTVFARQLNPENPGTKVSVDGGSFWCLGLKTEKPGTILEAKGGATAEVLGGYFYYNRGNTGAGAGTSIINDDSSVFVFAAMNGGPGSIMERRGNDLRRLDKWPFAYAGGR